MRGEEVGVAITTNEKHTYATIFFSRCSFAKARGKKKTKRTYDSTSQSE